MNHQMVKAARQLLEPAETVARTKLGPEWWVARRVLQSLPAAATAPPPNRPDICSAAPGSSMRSAAVGPHMRTLTPRPGNVVGTVHRYGWPLSRHLTQFLCSLVPPTIMWLCVRNPPPSIPAEDALPSSMTHKVRGIIFALHSRNPMALTSTCRVFPDDPSSLACNAAWSTDAGDPRHLSS